LRGKALDGQDITISYSDTAKETLMLVFSPTCGYCRRNWPIWSQLTSEAKDKRIVYVNIGGTISSGFTQQNSFGSAMVVASTTPQSILEYNLRVTPITLYLSPRGRVERVWSGEMSNSDLTEARNLLARQ
jgi:hypothetical protein